MSLFRLFIIFVFLGSAACGFHPVYSKKASGSASPEAVQALKSIAIDDITGRSGQELKNTLEDLLNPTSENAPKLYRLKISLDREVIPLIIEKDRRITRYRLVYSASFKIVDIATGEELYRGTSRMNGSYDAVNSDYAVYVTEGDTAARIVREMAADMNNKIASFFIGKAKK